MMVIIFDLLRRNYSEAQDNLYLIQATTKFLKFFQLSPAVFLGLTSCRGEHIVFIAKLSKELDTEGPEPIPNR
jgi:hypothetical protein